MLPEPPETSTRPIGAPLALYQALRDRDSHWHTVAAAFGFSILREPGAYVAYCGDNILRVAPYADLDPDDCLAQIVLHELCHFAVEGPDSRNAWDWGLDNTSDQDDEAERDALRVQAAILTPFGLRTTLAATTEFWRDYHNLPEAPLQASPRATAGAARLQAHPGYPTLHSELTACARLLHQAHPR